MDDKPPEPIEIPPTDLSLTALQGIVEAFVLREGTDYGEKEYSLEQKVAHVLRQLEAGEARIVFCPDSETVDIITVPRSGRALVSSLK